MKKISNLLDYLETSNVKAFATTPEALAIYEKVRSNALNVTISEAFVKYDNNDGTIVTYDESNLTNIPEEFTSKNISILSNASSDSGNRYSWIKLTVEAYDFGNNSYMFCGFFKWLTKPFFSGNDVITLGHDASISFDTDSAFGYYQCEYMTSPTSGTITSNRSFNFSLDKKNTTASTTGVGAKFPLQKTPDAYPAVHSGALYCNGWINNNEGGNIQVSYGHSQLSFDFSLEGAVTWLPSGGIKFNVTGYQDVATHGTAVRR
ncbi:hypothetical protein [Clostridium sp. UBA1652]|uniref:hypothetical protein n=1 Tax=Clostridium sp. UBA1652 TaxID=1946348 RepID=UPI00257D625D|nr:hypothetical protein [Clostridium sp. UBA1652]